MCVLECVYICALNCLPIHLLTIVYSYTGDPWKMHIVMSQAARFMHYVCVYVLYYNQLYLNNYLVDKMTLSFPK